MRLIGKRHLDPTLLSSSGLKLNNVRAIPMWFKWLDQFKNNLNEFKKNSKDEVEMKKEKKNWIYFSRKSSFTVFFFKKNA